MILSSKLKFFPKWFSLVIASIALMVLLSVIIGWKYWDETIGVRIALAGVLLLLIGIFGRDALNAKDLTIDTETETIFLKKRFTKSIKQLPFTYFDGYTQCPNFNSLCGFHYDLYLVKDKKAIVTIKSALYSNYSEILEGLSKMNNLGKLNRTILNEFKVFLGIKIFK